MKTLIIASSKPWHKAIFDQVNKKSNLKCSYISTPDELDSALKTNTNFHYIFFFTLELESVIRNFSKI